MAKINYAIVMCGGKAKHLKGINKSLVKYNGKTMLSYVLESISKTEIKKIIILANEYNYKEIEEEVRECKAKIERTRKTRTKKECVVLKNPPKRFREVILHIKNIIDNNLVLVVAGNQPMTEDFLEKIINESHTNPNSFVVTLYDKEISNESTFVSLAKKGFIQDPIYDKNKNKQYTLQHPFIISKAILKNQIDENFEYKIEETLKRMSKNIQIKGILAGMPPEFDNEEMLKTTKDYINRLNYNNILKIKSKMNTLIIPGNHISNKEWMERAKVELRTILPNIKLHYYAHWDENKPLLDFNKEIERLNQEIHKINKTKTKTNQNKELIVFAKSVGGVLALKMIKEGLIKPKKCIFLGFPVNWAIKNNFNIREWIKDYNTPTLFIQNNNDPMCTCKGLNRFIQENNAKNISNFSIVESEGETHDYDNYDLIKKNLSIFIKD